MKRDTRMETDQKDQNLKEETSEEKNSREAPEEDWESSNDDWEKRRSEKAARSAARRKSTRLLTAIQIGVCTAILAAAIALRLNGGTVYQQMKNWYWESLNDSIVADAQMDNIKHVVVNLWSTISNPRDSQTLPSSAQENGGNAAAPNSSSSSEKQAVSQGQGNSSASAQSQGSVPKINENAPSEPAAS